MDDRCRQTSVKRDMVQPVNARATIVPQRSPRAVETVAYCSVWLQKRRIDEADRWKRRNVEDDAMLEGYPCKDGGPEARMKFSLRFACGIKRQVRGK